MDNRLLNALGTWGRPLVVAHRGASGYLPEHTLEAYALAHGQGADFIEQDVVSTKDGIPICLHDIHLERVTDVAQRFPGRGRADGRFYAIDFTLDEVRRLSATGGTRHGLRGCAIPTFDEAVSLVRHLNERTGREVGIAPELKAPAFHIDEKRPLEGAFAAVLREYGYREPLDRCIVQCFDPEALIRLRTVEHVQCGLLELLSGDAPTAAELALVATRASAIGPSKAMIESTGGALVGMARGMGLAVIPYTFQDDEEEMARFFHTHGVDALFTDFPDAGLRARER